MNGKVGGDYYNVSMLKDGSISVFIADASGHGIQAALSTMQIDVLNRETVDIKPPNKRLEFINRLFISQIGTRNFFSGFMMYIRDGKIEFSGAGHPRQYLYKNRAGNLIELKTRGKPIGCLKESKYIVLEEPFDGGDILFLFTDGLFEVFDRNFREFGEERLKDLILDISLKSRSQSNNMPLNEMNRLVLDFIDKYRGKRPANDDITLIAIRSKQKSVY